MKKEARHVSRASAQKTSGTSEESAKTVKKTRRRRNGGKTKATRDNKFVLKRQWDILQALTTSPKGLTLEEMAALFDVSCKTIKRDLKTLEYAFGEFRTKNEAHGRKRYFYDGNPFSFSLSLDRDELLSIYVGQTLMTSLRGTFFWDGLQSSREKIKQILREETVQYAERVAPFFYRFEPTEMHYSEQMRRLVDQALISMVDSCALRIKYRSVRARRSKTYDVYPYNFIYWNSSIYLIGYCCRDRKIKTWKVDRLYDAKSLPQRKFSRENFDVDKYLSNSVAPFVGATPVTRVTVRFTRYAARVVEEQKLRSVVKLTKEPSGAIVVEMDTETGESFTRWVLGFGRHAEILAPEKIREEFLNELKSVVAHYSENGDDPVEYYEEDDRAAPKKDA
ncbi:MAG: helix-turn-helix transcriptional regulator [Thermoguttaceae bacterium]